MLWYGKSEAYVQEILKKIVGSCQTKITKRGKERKCFEYRDKVNKIKYRIWFLFLLHRRRILSTSTLMLTSSLQNFSSYCKKKKRITLDVIEKNDLLDFQV